MRLQNDGTEPNRAPLHRSIRDELRQLRRDDARKQRQGGQKICPRGAWTGPIPLSYAQERLWFLDQVGLVGAAYNIPLAFRLSGVLNIEALERSFVELTRRHEILRTNIRVLNGDPHQVIREHASIEIEQVDLSEVNDPLLREQKLNDRMSREQLFEFNLSEGQLFNLVLMRISEREHVLLVTIHHLISDGWSIGIMFRELGTLYSAYVRNSDSPLPELDIQYADYAIWQRSWLKGDTLKRQLSFWKEMLEGAPPSLQLPLDRPRPARESFKGATRAFELPKGLTEGMSDLARREGATLFMACLATYQILLARWSGQLDVVVGSPIAGRMQRELEGIIGFFVNTLPLRTQLGAEKSFRQILQEVRENTLNAYAHQDLPFEKLVKEIRPERNLTRQPIFQVWMAMQNYPEEQLALPNLTWGWTGVERVNSLFDLALYLEVTPEGMKGIWEYAIDLFDHQTIDRLSGNFKTLFKSILAQPDEIAFRLQILTQGESAVLELWNTTDSPYPSRLCLHQLFDEQVRKTPSAVAVEFEDVKLTYAELQSRADDLAAHLEYLRVGPEKLVGVYTRRSPAMVIGLLAVLKAGAAYVPLDPDLPPDRLSYMLTDAKPVVVLVQSALMGQIPSFPAEIVNLDTAHRSRIGSRPKGIDSQPRSLAYVIYTSGSTGQPKGAMNEHRAVVNRLHWMQRQYQLTNEDCVLQKTPFSFDVSVWEFFWTLLQGARLTIARPDGHKDPTYLREVIEKHGVTTLHFVPSMLQSFLDELPNGSCSNLRHVICSGEELSADIEQKLFERLPQVRLSNLYGPTEAAVDVTWWECRRDDPRPRVPIGRPIDNAQIFILDSYMQPVPVGVTGEIFIGGVAVGRGYLNRPTLTAERFVANPFNCASATRLYKTGDLGRWRSDGAIDYLGRTDHQVKIRGYRIELGEIETSLRLHHQVKEAVVVARQDSRAEKQLVAYVVREANPSIQSVADSTEKLRGEMVSDWETLYEQTYGGDEQVAAPSFVSWNSSYTGEPLPKGQMDEWLANIVERVRELRPTRAIEIGCGVGLVLQHVAPQCVSYVGTDISASAIRGLGRWASKRPNLAHVQLLQRSADDLHEFGTGSFDTVILNSVVQYFPDIEYLIHVLREAVRLVSPQGAIFVGDVRHLGLLPAFHTSIQLRKVPDTLPISELRSRIARGIENEKELVIDPGFFHALPETVAGISGVEVRIKSGSSDNELTRYRYDVVLRVDPKTNLRISPKRVRWGRELECIADLEIRLKNRSSTPISGVSNVPDQRLARDMAALKLLDLSDGNLRTGELKAKIASMDLNAINPDELGELLCAHGYQVILSPGEPGYFDALPPDQIGEHRTSEGIERQGKKLSLSAYANSPMESGLRQQFIVSVRSFLEELLPEYMVPSAWVILKRLPLSANGKVDRKALPSAEVEAKRRSNSALPQGEIEVGIAQVWQEILQLQRVGRDENFFYLGGHSLIALKVLFAINQKFKSTLRIIDLYQNPTVSALAVRMKGAHQNSEFVDLRSEAWLDKKVMKAPGRLRQPSNAILITGATGFVGRFLLTRILCETDATVYCFIRASGTDHGVSRLEKTLRKWSLWQPEFERRIVPVCGDLTRPRLGISDSTFVKLTNEVDSIYHCGVSMNHLETYEMARPANVQASKELIELATIGKPKLVNYISSLGIFNGRGGSRRLVDEESDIQNEKHLRSEGYIASKWVCENIFKEARERGIACNVLRVGLAWPDTQRGRYDDLQWGYRIIKSCLLSGYGIRDYHFPMPPTPVDYIARAVVALCGRFGEGGGIFHISSSSQLASGFFERCNEVAETKLKLLPFYDWIQMLKRLHQGGQTLPEVPLVEYAFNMDEAAFEEYERSEQESVIRYDCTRTYAELERDGITAPALNDDLLRLSLRAMLATDPELQEFVKRPT